MSEAENTPNTPPETTPPETQAQHPEHTGEHVDPHAETRATVSSLSDRITSLENVVQGLLPENQDEKPGKSPWTHKRF